MKPLFSILLLSFFLGNFSYASPTEGLAYSSADRVVSPTHRHLDVRSIRGIDAILGAHHLVPSKTHWQQLMKMPGAVPYLERVAKNNYAPLLWRQRALAGLAFMAAPSSIPMITRLVQNRQEPIGVRASAAESLATLRGSDAVSELAPLLAHPKLRLREAVMRAFRHFRDARGLSELRAQLLKEKNSILRRTLRGLITAQVSWMSGERK